MPTVVNSTPLASSSIVSYQISHLHYVRSEIRRGDLVLASVAVANLSWREALRTFILAIYDTRISLGLPESQFTKMAGFLRFGISQRSTTY